MPTHEAMFFLASYLLGALPGELFICYITRKKEIEEGKKRFFTEGKTGIIGTLLLNGLKGALPVIYGMRCFDSPVIIICGGAAALIGQLFPVFTKFKGGTGVAALVGMFLVFNFPAVVVFFVFFFFTLVFTKYISAASLTGVSALFFYILLTGIVEISIVVFIMAILIIVKHGESIKKMAYGTENRLNREKNG